MSPEDDDLDETVPPEHQENDPDATIADTGYGTSSSGEELDPDATIVDPMDAPTIVDVDQPLADAAPNNHEPVAPFDRAEDVDPNAATYPGKAYDPVGAATEAMTVADGPGPTTRKHAAPTVPYSSVPGLDNAPELDGFRITGKLGEGGMGVVWKAIQLSTNREVALKLLPPSAIGSEKAQARFQREVETAANVEHPYIAAIYESGIDKGIYFYAMQSIDGEELHKYVKQQKMGQREILQLMKKVCDGVHYAHLNGIIHRDLKPGNVLVTKNEGDPKILDFGLAKNVTDEDNQVSMVGEVMGTPMYMSTEQAQGNVDDIDGRTDVYSLGVMLYELLTEKFPYATTGGAIEIIRRKFKEPPTRPRVHDPKMDLDLEAVILKAIEPQTALRYMEADHLSRDIENILNNRPVTARRHTKGYVFSKWLIRNRMGIAALFAVAALSAGIYFGTDLLNQGEVAKAKKAQEELKATAAEATTAAEEAITKQFDQLTDNITAAGAQITNGQSIAAATLIEEIEEQFATNKENERFASFEPSITALKQQLADLQAKDAARISGIEKAGQAFANLAQTQVESIASLDDGLLQQLGFLYQEYKDSGYLEDPAVETKKNLIAEKVLAIAQPHINSRSDLQGRTDRLSNMRRFANDPRFTSLFQPTAERLSALIAEEEKLHVCALVNREVDNQILVTQKATGKTYTIDPDGEEVLPLAYEDSAAFAFTSVRLNPDGQTDPYYLPKAVSIAPIKAGGSVIEIDRHTAKTIPITFTGDRIKAEHSPNEKGPWQPIANTTTLVPGTYYAKFTRADYKPLIRPFSVDVDQTKAIIPVPPSDAWLPMEYLMTLAEVERLEGERKFVEALQLAQSIPGDDIQSQETREKIASYTRELANHPVIILGDQLETARAQVDDFILSYVQYKDPTSTFFGKPFRYQQGEQTIPSYRLPDIGTDKLGLLIPADAIRYTYLKGWQEVFTQPVEGLRNAASSFLANYATQHPDHYPEDITTTQAILQWDGKSDAPADIASQFYGARWVAHQQYKKGKKGNCEKALTTLAAFAENGGQPNSFDVQLALYAAYYPMNETVSAMKGMTPDSNQFKGEVKYGGDVAAKLRAILTATPSSELNTGAARALANTKNDTHFSTLMTFALSELNIDPEKRNIGEKLHEKALANSKENAGDVKFYLQFAKYFL